VGRSLTTGIISIASDAFRDCSSLASVNITDVSAWCNIEFSSPFSNPLYNDEAELYLNGNE